MTRISFQRPSTNKEKALKQLEALNSGKKFHRLNVNIEYELWKNLKKKALDQDIYLTDLVAGLLEKYCKENP